MAIDAAESDAMRPPQSSVVVGPEVYELPPEALDQLEAAFVANFKEQTGQSEGVVCVVAAPDSHIANFVRTVELKEFTKKGEEYDFHAGMAPHEARSRFLLTVDLAAGKVAHTKRLVLPLTETEREESGLTGIEAFDDRINAAVAEEHLELDDITRLSNIEDVAKCLNVATNNRTYRIEQDQLEQIVNPYTLISYKGVYLLVEAQGDIENIIAYVNRFALGSLGALGLQSVLLGGAEYHLPVPGDEERYDTKYTAVVIPVNDHNTKAFTQVDPENELTALIADREVPLFELGADESTLQRIA